MLLICNVMHMASRIKHLVLKAKEHLFLFLTLLWYLILQRMDNLVCPRLEYDFRMLLAWWLFMPLLVVLTGVLIYSTKKSLWKSAFFILCYPAMLLDFWYILEVPAPEFWANPSFVWWWHPACLIFHYPWTIKEQIAYWTVSFIALAILYFKKVFYSVK